MGQRKTSAVHRQKVSTQSPWRRGEGFASRRPVSSDAENQPPAPVFEPHEKVCGNCKLWRPHSLDAQKGWVGECRVQPQRALFPPSAPICNVFAARGEAVRIAHEAAALRAALGVA